MWMKLHGCIPFNPSKESSLDCCLYGQLCSAGVLSQNDAIHMIAVHTKVSLSVIQLIFSFRLKNTFEKLFESKLHTTML